MLHLHAKGRLTQWRGLGFAACLDFSPRGQMLATGHADGTIHLWDLAPAWQALTAPPQEVDVAACWSNLAAADAATAYTAIGRLASAPGPAVRMAEATAAARSRVGGGAHS